MTATSISSPRTARVRARPSAPSCRRRTGRRWRRPRGPPASTKGSESRSQEIHHGPAGEADKTEQHHKRISINITRFQSHREPRAPLDERRDRKSIVKGKRVAVRVHPGGGRINKKKK